MSYTKLTVREKENKLQKLKVIKSELELGTGKYGNKESQKMIKAWQIFLSLPIEQRVRIKQAWDEYYENVKRTPICALFQEQRNSAYKNNWTRLNDLARQARLMRKNTDNITLDKPTSIDIWEFSRGYVKAYMDCEEEIKELVSDLAISEISKIEEGFS